MKRWLPLLILTLLLPSIAFALTIASQTNSGTSMTDFNCAPTSGGPCEMRLGTGLSGTAQTFTDYAWNSSATNHVVLYECPDSTYTSCTSVATSNTTNQDSTAPLTWTFSSPYTLNASKYYYVDPDPAELGFGFLGNGSTGAYPFYYHGGTSNTVKQAYFSLDGASTASFSFSSWFSDF